MPASPDWLPLAKPLLAAGLLCVLWVLETLAPMYLDHRDRVRHDLRNLGLGLLNTLLVAVPFASAMVLATRWAEAHGFGLARWLGLPGWGAWPLALLLMDAWMYLWHRLNHRVPLLWRLHAVHHSDRTMDASSALRFHTGEIALGFLARLLVLPLIGMTMPQLLLYEAILLPVILFHHSNVRVPRAVDAALRWLIVTPRMHWVHHSMEREETDSNFSSVLSLWDRCFGTFRLRPDPERIRLGLPDHARGARWRTLPEMLTAPFTPAGRDAGEPPGERESPPEAPPRQAQAPPDSPNPT